MADTEFFQPQKKESALEKKFSVENKFVISYTGALGFANGLESMLECAKMSEEAKLPIHFLVCGEGAMSEPLQQLKSDLKLTNVTFLGFRNRDGIREILNVTDAMFISYKPVPILETGSPNKYFDGLAAGKLIVINFGGWIKEEIEKERCGFSFDAKHPSLFIRQISSYVTNAAKLRTAQIASRSLAEKKYSRRILSDAFVSSILSD
jgi:glycosyltransferase involved in cell wall biosynthesis